MLLSEAVDIWRYRLRGTTLAVVAVVLVTLLGACGFRPLYGGGDAGSLGAEQNLALIDILPIEDRIGQQLRNNLLNRLTPKGRPADPRYTLSIILNYSVASLGVRKTAVATRGNLTATATYILSTSVRGDGDQADKATLASGSVVATSSYDIPQAQYAALAAQKDARTRAVKEIADDLKTRLAVYFQQNRD